MRSSLSYLLVGAVLPFALSAPLFKAIWLPKAAEMNQARCLDGSPPVYYFRRGSGEGLNKFLLFHEGGGWCSSEDECSRRAATYLGTSFLMLPYMDIEFTQAGNLLSSDPTKSPLLYNWNHVFIHYCDGGFFSGNRPEPFISLADNKTYIHMAGKRVHDAILDDLIANHGLGKASDVVVTGASAGGLAVVLRADAVREKLPKATKVVGVPIAGFLWEHEAAPCGFVTKTKDMWNVHNPQASVNQACVASKTEEDAWRCLLVQDSLPYVNTPLFFLQSRYDPWVVLNIFCRNEGDGEGITADSELMVDAIIKTFTTSTNAGHGAVIDSCYHHYQYRGSKTTVDFTFDEWNSIKTTTGMTSEEAFRNWYRHLDQANLRSPTTGWVDISNQPYGCGAQCCGTQW